MIFVKMQLNGNDFVFVNNRDSGMLSQKDVIKRICNRNQGIGADGMVMVSESDEADYKLEIYNADGSQAKMCGNALLLFGKYLYESDNFGSYRLKGRERIRVETQAGLREIKIEWEGNEIKRSEVDMGRASFERLDGGKINYVSIGNLHGVIFLESLDEREIERLKKEYGEMFDKDKAYNLELVKVIDKRELRIKIFERGVGETLSCGTGASAAVAVAIKKNICSRDEDIRVISRGGEHILRYTKEGNIFLSGKPELVYHGYLKI